MLNKSKTKIKSILLPILFFGIFGLVKESQAADWFVRPAGGDYGNENGTSYASAWDGLESIVWGNGGMATGDNLYICGTHIRTVFTNNYFSQQGMLSPAMSGSESKHIVIRGDCPGDPGIIWKAYKDDRQGGMVPDNWAGPDSNGIYHNETAVWNGGALFQGVYEEINGATGKRYTRSGSISDLKIAGPGAYFDETFGTNQTRIYVKPFAQDTFKDTIRYMSSGGGWRWALKEGISYVEWRSLTMIGGGIEYQNQSAGASPIHHLTFDNCKFFRAGNIVWSPWVSNNILFNNCEFGYVGAAISATWSHGTIEYIYIQNSYFHNIGTPYGVNSDNHAIGIQDNQHFYIRGNHFRACSSAIDFHVGANMMQKHIYIQRNFIEDMRADMGGIWPGRGIQLEGDDVPSCDLVDEAYIEGNVLRSGKGLSEISPWLFSAGISSSRQCGVHINNNTVYDFDRNYYFNQSAEEVGIDVTFKNNISISPRQLHIGLNNNQSGVTYTFDSDNNLYYPDGNYFYFQEGGIGTWTSNFSDWKAHCLLHNNNVVDTHSLIGDPLLIGNGKYLDKVDFIPTSASPAIDAGTDVGLTTDFDGHPIVDAPDIGAYEYQDGNDTILPNIPTGLNAR